MKILSPKPTDKKLMRDTAKPKKGEVQSTLQIETINHNSIFVKPDV